MVSLDLPDTDMTFEKYALSSPTLKIILITLVQSVAATEWASLTVAGLTLAQYLC